jgi:hypothetical protein
VICREHLSNVQQVCHATSGATTRGYPAARSRLPEEFQSVNKCPVFARVMPAGGSPHQFAAYIFSLSFGSIVLPLARCRVQEDMAAAEKKWKFAFYKDTYQWFEGYNGCEGGAIPDFGQVKGASSTEDVTDRQSLLNTFKNTVVEQSAETLWKEVVGTASAAIAEQPSPQDSGDALSVKLDPNWRVSCAVAKDDTTVLVAHVFKSRHKEKHRGPKKCKRVTDSNYTCMIGASKDADPPGYRIQDI